MDDYPNSDTNIYTYGGNHYGGNKNTRHTGVFEELMELDIINNIFEKFDVPSFDDVMSASIVHDFQKVKYS